MLLGSIISGCDKGDSHTGVKPEDDEKPEVKDDKGDDVEKEKEDDEKEGEDGKITDTPVTLTYWYSMDGSVAKQFDNMGEVEMYKELEKRTGVEIEFIHPPEGQTADEHFQFIIFSDDVPDLVEREWHKWPGGPEKALEDEIIIELNELIDKYALNLKKVLGADEYLNKSIKTDTGKYIAFPFAQGDESLMVYRGPIMRKDWLDDLGLDIPTTIDEWYEVLREFKENKGATAPYSTTRSNTRVTGNIVSAYGALYKEFFNDNGEIKYGPMQPGYKAYLETMNQWYKEGLLDAEYASQNAETYHSKILGGETGAFVHLIGGGIGGFMNTMKDEDPSFDLIGVPYPTLNKGDKPMYGQRHTIPIPLVAITPSCEEKEVAVKWLDYAYGEEGHMLFNFGVEGLGYEMIDGYPTYTEDITDNPDGLTMQEGLAKHCRAGHRGPFIKDKRYFEQYQTYDAQVEAVKTWAQADGDTQMPLIYPAADESEKFSTIMEEVTAYVRGMSEKFISGEEPIEKFDEFLENMDKMGIKEAISIQQAALERFNKR